MKIGRTLMDLAAEVQARAAADVDSYDRATELEALGWQVIDLPESAWREKWAA